MRITHRSMAAAVASMALLGVTSNAFAQDTEAAPAKFYVEARGGINVPTFDIADAADAGPSFGAGIGYQLNRKLWLLADADFGFHSGADLPGGGEGPDVNVNHYVAKLGYEVFGHAGSPWSVIVNAGGGALTFDVDGAGSSNTYPAINVGAKITYRMTPTLSIVLSPQGDIAFTKEDVLGTDNAWVWPFTAGFRLGF